MANSEALNLNLIRRSCVGDMLAFHANRIPDKTVLKFSDNTYSYNELNTHVNRLAHGLSERGIGRGDCVAVLSHNCDLFLITWFALMKIGALMVPVNWLYKGKEIQYIIDHSEAVMIIAEDILVENVDPLRQDMETVEHYVYFGLSGTEVPAYWVDIHALMTDDFSMEEPETIIHPDDPAVMIYTSGTESAPKGVLITHLNLAISIAPAQYNLMFDENSCPLIGLPFFHLAALQWFVFTVGVGGKAVVLYLPDPREILRITQKEKINGWTWVTTLYVTMLQILEKESYDLSSLKSAVVFGSYVSPILMRNWKKHAPGITFISAYGQSECVFCTSISGPDFEKHPDSVGLPFLGTRLKIVGPDGETLPPGQSGEIVIRSPSVMLGYYKNEEKTREAQRGGWHHTGDIGKLDEEGFLYFVDRVKDMIKTGGENVASTDVEETIFSHPKVLEVAVIGLRHPVWQEAVTAVVTPKSGETLTPAEIIDHCKDKIAAYKVPKKVFIMEALPKSNMGKILKKDLKHTYAGAFDS